MSALERLKTLCSERFYFWCYAGFLAGYFLFPQAPEHYRYYYILVLLPLVAGCVKGLAEVGMTRWYALVLAYIGYMVISALWSEPFSWREFARVAWYGALVAGFVLATARLRCSDALRFERLLRALVVLAALAGLLSIVVWYSKNPFPQTRLQALSRMDHEILAACAYGFFALLALHFARLEQNRWWKTGFFIALLVLVATVVLTQSRTAMVALVVTALMLAGSRGHRLLFAVAALAAVALMLQPDLWQALTRGMPFRPGIWANAFEAAARHWLFGTGYLSDTSVQTQGITFVHAHNAYLATFRDGGLVGLVLMLAVFGTALIDAFRLDRRNGQVFYLALVLYGLLCAIPDLDRVLSRPREFWLFLWLPVTLALVDASRCGNPRPTR